MNKLETITELLVNELTDFEKNVTQLSSQIDKVESFRVKFDVSPIKGLISQLEEFGRRETERRNQYLNRLEQNIKNAKIYPKWAVIIFIVSLLLAFGALFFGYTKVEQMENVKKEAYTQGIQAYEQHLDIFFKDNPKVEAKYKAWRENKDK